MSSCDNHLQQVLIITAGAVQSGMTIKEALWSWIADNEVVTLVEEGEDILDGLAAMLTEEDS